MTFKKIVVTLACFLFMVQLYSQNINQAYTLNWHKPYHQKISDDIIMSYLYFDNASISKIDNKTPLFWCAFPIENGNVDPEIAVQSQIWQVLTSEELNLIDINAITDSLNVNTFIEYTRKVPALKIEFLPFRKNGSQYEKLISFQISGSLKTIFPQRIHKNGVYTNNSILNNEGFYKIGITETGIHRITYSDLSTLGINVTSLRTADIAIFGNGGRMLPESTNVPVFDDLPEVAIQIVDNNNNGIFESTDYILFYGVGVKNWNYSLSGTTSRYPFVHELNLYTSQTYYFINVNASVGTKKRVQNMASLTTAATHTVNSYPFHDVHEKDLVNIAEVGRLWFGEEYNLTTSYDYSFSIPGIIRSEQALLRVSTATKSSVASRFTLKVNNASTFNISCSARNEGEEQKPSPFDFYPTGDNIDINVTYNKPQNSIGWLDYIEIHARCALAQHLGMFSFQNPDIVGTGNIAEYQFDSRGKNTQIWDITDQHNIKKVNALQNGNSLSFRLAADSLREFIAFDGSSFHSVTPIGKVSRQNLHGLSNLDFIIITHPNFLEAANKLAHFRRNNDNLRVEVVTTTQIYNEFGSGGCDIGAIRNFIKMFYDRETADNMPKNVLLIGKTSFDPRNINGSNSCFIPNYQGSTSIFGKEDCPSFDNFFVKLAGGKGNSNSGTMDMGLGRFPVYTNSQAIDLVNQSINYASYDDMATSSGNNEVSNLGNWRNIVAFLADDWEKGMFHMEGPEGIQPLLMDKLYLNVEKIYCDAYKKESSSEGTRYTEATRAMNDRINKGCLMFTYYGHGGDKGWSHERLLLRSDIYSWKNKHCLPLFFAACCSFGMYDKKEGTSPSEDMLLKTDGGAIALITPTRKSSNGTNNTFGKYIYIRAFEKNNNKYLTLGEIWSKAHADVNGGGVEMYVLMGDPSITLAHPKYNVVTDSINGVSVTAYNDTIKALQYVTISGHIADLNNNKLNNFNGWVYPSVYDKSDSVSTINPSMDAVRFPLQKSMIFKGKSKVTNGNFSFTFIVPLDINYEYGLGKISYYAVGEKSDAKGFAEFLIGGMNDTILDDKEGPEIRLYFNDEKFAKGGITTPTPILHAKISDKSGINTTGAGIGHDMLAIIDGDISKSIILNDYFEYDTNSFVSGSLSYALNKLEEGHHTLTLRAWDVINNMGEETIDFEVINNDELKINHVLNYPNPFTTSTQFFFEHNQPNNLLHVRVQIFTVSGKLVKTIIQTQQNTGFRSDPIPWNGLDDFGDKLARGIYIYKLQVMTQNGKSTEKIEKIAIL